MKQTEQTKFDLSLYNDEFFKWHLTHVHESSVKCMEWYCEQYNPKSVLDIGCGIGSYLLGALNKGVSGYGIEISEQAKKYTDEKLKGRILYDDATNENLWSYNYYDCSICLEVAEHVEPEKSEKLIQTICGFNKGRILFSAAPIGQDGTGHINCQPKQFWIDLFAKFNRHLLESTTEHIANNWKRLGAPDYIINNLMVL